MTGGEAINEQEGRVIIVRKHKGQVLVEFALVLPFFLLLVFGIIYSGMLFYDYSTLSNVARSVAREKAITEPNETITEEQINTNIKERYFKNGRFIYGLVTSLYHPAQNALEITGPTDKDDIIVKVTMELGESSYLMRMILPPQYSVVYHMRKDYK